MAARLEASAHDGEALRAALDKALGGRTVLARAYGTAQVGSEQYDQLLDRISEWAITRKLDSPEKIARYCRKAARADFGHTYVTFLFAGLASYGVAGLALWMTSVAAAMIFPPVLAIVAPGIFALAVFWYQGVHALYAGARVGALVNESQREGGATRARFTRAARPKTIKSAWAREMLAQAPGTTLGVCGVVALKLALGLVQALPSWFLFLGSPLTTLVGALFSPLAFSMRDVMDKRTYAPLFGVKLDSVSDGRPNSEASLNFSRNQADANIKRLKQNTFVRGGRTVARFAAAYNDHFGRLYADERSRGVNKEKLVEVAFGGLPMSVGALLGASIMTLDSSAFTSTVVSAARSAGTSLATVTLTNPLTSGRVWDNVNIAPAKTPERGNEAARAPIRAENASVSPVAEDRQPAKRGKAIDRK